MSYDPKCYELALHFLEDKFGSEVPANYADRLAQAIQQTIEDYFMDEDLN